jgi:hypothetical protein
MKPKDQKPEAALQSAGRLIDTTARRHAKRWS